MAVVAGDIKIHLAAAHATNDADGQGGAIDATGRVLDSQFAAAAVAAFVSDSAADTQNATVVGRLATGIIATEVVGLTGVSEVLSTAVFERILSVTLASAATGTVLLKQGTGGTTRHTFAPAEDLCRTLFYGATANPTGGGDKVRYEKVFVKNTHASLAALGLTIAVTTDPRTDYDIDLEDAVDDDNATANRLTAPAGADMLGAPTFGDGPLACPGTDLAAGSAIGTWLRCTLAEATAPTLDVVELTSSFSST